MISEDFEKIELWLKEMSAPFEITSAVSRIKKDVDEWQSTPINNTSISLLREARTELSLLKLSRGLCVRILNHMKRVGVE